MKPSLTQERLKELLNYDIKTGIFTWLKPRKGIDVGNIAGAPDKDGYLLIGVDGKIYRAHRLAWFYVYGLWPKYQLDHKDNIISNNKLDNLREANNSQNQQNRGVMVTNKLGIKGVKRSGKKFNAVIRINGKATYLGTFDSAEEAGKAYAKAASSTQGEFAHGSLNIT